MMTETQKNCPLTSIIIGISASIPAQLQQSIYIVIMKHLPRKHETAASLPWSTRWRSYEVKRMTDFRCNAVKLHMAKPYFIFHAPQARFIWKKQPDGLAKVPFFRLTCQMMTETQKRLSSDFYYNWNIRINTCSITAKHLYCNNEAFAPQTWTGSFAAMKYSLTLVWSEAHDRLSA